MNEQLKRFISNPDMSQAVHDALKVSFMRRRPGEDTEMKAARFLALELLEESWRDLERHRGKGGTRTKEVDYV